MAKWIGVDLDGTLAEESRDNFHPYRIGKPIPKMLQFTKELIAAGETVKIFTARVSVTKEDHKQKIITAIQDWLEIWGLPRLEVTNIKSQGLKVLFDDRAYHVIPNTGLIVFPEKKE
jgi:hypothetical protein